MPSLSPSRLRVRQQLVEIDLRLTVDASESVI
jgi:hypothetical protein